MSRSTWKGPFTEEVRARSRVWSRRSIISPAHIGKEFLVHNGKNFVSVRVVEEMCSQKFGEFAATRKKVAHKFNKRKQMHKKMKTR